MKKQLMFLFVILFISLVACVQPTSLKTVNINLVVKGKKDIQSVGVRGGGNPLSWDKDLPMQAVVKDSLYTVSFTTRTAFNFIEAKFTVDGAWEFNDKPNRKIEFEKNKDTVMYSAVYGVE